MTNEEEGSEKTPIEKAATAEPKSTEEEPAAKKRKIWSIADTVASSSGGEQSSPTETKKSDSSPVCSSASGPSSALHYSFNPWQQQIRSPLLSPNGRAGVEAFRGALGAFPNPAALAGLFGQAFGPRAGFFNGQAPAAFFGQMPAAAAPNGELKFTNCHRLLTAAVMFKLITDR